MRKFEPSKVTSKFLRTVPVNKVHKENKANTAISLFSGAGGAALGLAAAGFEIRVMVEWEKAACDTLRLNWIDDRPKNWRELRKKDRAHDEALEKKLGDKYFEARDKKERYWWQERPPAIMNVDITKTSTEEILRAGDLQVGEATILEGGFPCQGFSSAGARMIDDPRNVLYKECVRVIGEALPRSFLLENVPGLVSMDKGRIIKQICDDLVSVGYDLTWDILNAADYGVPQNRKRVIFVGKRIDAMSFDGKTGKAGLHMGALRGTVTHPDWFRKRYSNLFQKTLFAA
jgi:site-specific DNA-cytosine methylase